MSLVCKQWNSLITIDRKLKLETVLSYYAKNGTISSLKLIRSIIKYILHCSNLILSSDTKFFVFAFFYNARKEIFDWAINELQPLSSQPTQMVTWIAQKAAFEGYLDLLQSITIY